MKRLSFAAAGAMALSALASAYLAYPDSAQAASGPACFRNPGSTTNYYSVRWPNGTSNFVLKPGETHRLNQMNDQDTYFCWDSQPIGNSCPNRTALRVNNC